MKWLGAILTLASFLWLARAMAKPYRRRVAALEDWRQILGTMETLIGWKTLPLAEVFEEVARTHKDRAPAINVLLDGLASRDEDFASAFLAALEQDAALFAEDREVLGTLAPILGRSGVAYETRQVADVRQEVQRVLGEARQKVLKKAHLVESLVSAMGMAALILLI